ncbi:MAG: hypothetical protein ACAH88_18780 [Roseimicrobium sp.]
MLFTIQRIEGRHCPIAICDHCKKPIDDCQDASATYDQPGAPVMFHHLDCEDRAKPRPTYTIPLDLFMVQAAHGLQVDWKEARAAAERYGQLG